MSRYGSRTRVSTYTSAWMPTGDETPQNPSSIEILLVGGGGSSGSPNGSNSAAGGGGAGGMYSSVSGNPSGGPGGSVQPTTPISAGVTYTVTIGGTGTASTFSAPTISTISANAGNGGGGAAGAGGAAGTCTGQPLAYGGGGPGYIQPAWSQGTGGGGAGSAGYAGGNPYAGQGGNSKTNTIRADSPSFPQSYSGGGATGGVSGQFGAGPPGGGTYGRGGGAGSDPGGSANSGQPGVCVFRYPDTFPTASTTTGSPTLTTTGGYHIYTFTSSGTVSW